MKKFILYLLFPGLLIHILACNQADCIDGSGKQATQVIPVQPFTKVKTEGSVKIILKQDSIQEVKIVADDNIQDYITTQVRGGQLSFEMERNFCNSGPIILYITAKKITGVEASGAVDLTSDNKIKATDFELNLSGDSKVDLDIMAANLKTEASGSASIRLRGQAGNHEVRLSGEGNIEALDFVVGNYKINTSGSSQMQINVLNNLEVESSGTSQINYRGNPKHVHNDQSGASTLKKIE